jgi:MarR family 2-MHQ and catechol resistance regulon transcriptional repressor
MEHDETAGAPDFGDSLSLWIAVARAHRAVAERARRHVESSGLTPSEFAVLEVLHHRGPLLIGEIGERVLLTSGSMTYVVDKLEGRGLVRRTPCERDRRAQRAHLTPAGTELIERIFPEHARTIHEAMAELTAEEKRAAASVLRKIARSSRRG